MSEHIVPRRLAGPVAPGIADGITFTARAGKVTTVDQLVLANTTAIAQWVSWAIGGTAVTVGNCLGYQVLIPASDTVVITYGSRHGAGIPMAGAEEFHMIQGTADAITATISGAEK